MRKINSNEIKPIAKIFTEIFKDYKPYDLFFKRNKFQQKRIYQFFLYETYESQNYCYVSDDKLSVCAIKLPGDKSSDPKNFFINPLNKLAFCFWTGKRARKLAVEYLKMADDAAKKYYDPATDCYIKNIGVAKSARGQGRMTAMLRELCGDKPIYLESHIEDNVKMYQKMGFEICNVIEWNGFKHYAMKRA